MGIYIAIGEIIHGAAGRAHQKYARDENEEHPVIGMAIPGDPERPQSRPQEQKRTDGAVDPNQPAVCPEPLGQPQRTAPCPGRHQRSPKLARPGRKTS
jgi:hypothetical protein